MSTNPNDQVFGRESELVIFERFLDGVPEGPSALLIEGDVGAGKTTLWSGAIDAARRRSCRILACRPVESEVQLSFAALGDLLEGVLAEALPGVPAPQRRILDVALLRSDPEGAPPDQRAISVATLGVLRALSQASAVVVAVDDVRWLDRPSTRILEFALRRLTTERVSVIATQRTDDGAAGLRIEEVIPAGRVHRMAAAPLGPDAIDQMLRSRLSATFPRRILRHLHHASGGNPLFALEIGRALSRSERRADPGQLFPVPKSLKDLVRDRLASLTPEATSALLVVAALSHSTPELVRAALAQLGGIAGLQEALDAGVLAIDDARIRFSHPVLGSVLYSELPHERRRMLHECLARVVSDAEERARHLALAVEHPDAGVAVALDEAARSAIGRGAADAAAELAEQALRLTPPDDRDEIRRRSIEAAEYHFSAGDTPRARGLLEGTLAALPPGPFRANVLRRLAKVRYRSDSCFVAADLLAEALEEAGEDPSVTAGIERDLSWAAALCGDMRDAAVHARNGLQLAERNKDAEMLPELLAAVAMTEFTLGRDVRTDLMRRAGDLEHDRENVPIEWRPTTTTATISKWSGDFARAGSLFAILYQQAIELGDESSLPFLLYHMSELATWEGKLREALAYAEEADTITLGADQGPIRALVLYAKALAEAHLGQAETSRRDAESGLECGERSGSVLAMLLNQGVLGFLELSLENPADAHAYLGPLESWRDVVGIEEPGMLRFAPDEIESLVSLGELEKAEALLEKFEAQGRRVGRVWAVVTAARCRALLLAGQGRLDASAALLHEALEGHRHLPQPFELARTLLVDGAIKRRLRRTKEARESTQNAAGIFEELGAALWGDRALRDMAGGGARLAGPTALTPAEERVAELVASGSTNKEAAGLLFVSVRAVETHLTSIYRKLGLRSRTELALRLRRDESEAPSR